MGDWLGTYRVANQLIKYRSFKKARNFVKDLNLKSGAEWTIYCKSGKKPNDIPFQPHGIYKNKGWKGWKDFLGTK